MRVGFRLLGLLALALTSAGAANAASLGVVATGIPASAPATIPTANVPTANGDVLFRADSLSYDARTAVVTASGNVEMTQGDRLLKADSVTYNQNTREVVAQGNVSLSDGQGNSLFANRIELTDDMKNGVIETLTVLLAERGKLAAARATRKDGTVMTLERAIYTSCDTCKDDPTKPPVWQIKALKVTYDKVKARIEYEDAYFELLGVPIVYLPYFAHSDPAIKRQSGFLIPNVGHSTDIGYFLEVPYFWALDPSYDLTVAVMATQEDSALLKTEWRHRTHGGIYNLDGSFTYAETRDRFSNKTGEEAFASHLFGTGRFDIDKTWRWGYDLQLTSNDTYLKRYDISNLDRLTNNVFLEGIYGRSYASANAWYFQGLREADDPGTTPLVLPFLELSWVPDEAVFGGRFSFDANVMSLYRGEGRDTVRVSTTAEWRLPFVTAAGQLWTIFANLRGDVYHTRQDGPFGTDTNLTGRVLPTTGVEWRWPFLRHDGHARTVIEPIIQAIIAPYGGNPDDIPNEDSDSFEFDEANLFSLNKFPGLDRWESGPRINAGIRAASYFSGDNFVELILGETFRLREDRAFTAQSGLRDQQSDFVGRITLQPIEDFRIVHRFRINKDNLTFERNEVYAEFSDDELYSLQASYVRLADDVVLPIDVREEVYVNGKVRVAPYWFAHAAGRRDLDEEKMIESRVGLTYEDECSEFGLEYRRRFTRDRDIEPNSSVLFTFRLKAVN